MIFGANGPGQSTMAGTVPAGTPKITAVVFAVALAVVTATSVTGCADRTYLTKSHGRANTEAFVRQKVPPGSSPRDPKLIQGLDSQEAAVVARTYRQSLGKEVGADGQNPSMVIMNPSMGATPTPYMPPPSVPSGP